MPVIRRTGRRARGQEGGGGEGGILPPDRLPNECPSSQPRREHADALGRSALYGRLGFLPVCWSGLLSRSGGRMSNSYRGLAPAGRRLRVARPATPQITAAVLAAASLAPVALAQ